MKLDRDRAALVVIDVQEAFRKALPSFDEVAARRRRRWSAARPRSASRWSSPSSTRRASARPCRRSPSTCRTATALDKVRFSAAEADGFDLGGRDQALVCGIEAHVCVNQTVLDLLDEDVEVHVAADAVGSRTEANRELGLAKMERAGALLTSVETALFELLGAARTPRRSRRSRRS